MALQIVFDSPALPVSTQEFRRSFGVVFDGDATVYSTNLGTATTAIIEGGPRGLRGEDGMDPYEHWLSLGNVGTYEDFQDSIRGPMGVPGPSGFLVWDTTLDEYPARPIPGVPVAFAGPVNPDDLGIMIDGDVWLNVPEGEVITPDIYVPVDMLDPWVANHVATVTSQTRAAILAVVDETVGSYAVPKDVRFKPVAGVTTTSVDEFEDDVLAAAWVRADPAGTAARVTWGERAGRVYFTHTGGDAASIMHSLLRPVTPLAVGEAWETCLSFLHSVAASPPMLGLMCATSDQATQFALAANIWGNTGTDYGFNLGIRQHTNLSAATGGDGGVINGWTSRLNFTGPLYIRLARTGANQFDVGVSPDGVAWVYTNRLVPVQSTAVWSYAGFYCSTWGRGEPQAGSFDYLRKVVL